MKYTYCFNMSLYPVSSISSILIHLQLPYTYLEGSGAGINSSQELEACLKGIPHLHVIAGDRCPAVVGRLVPSQPNIGAPYLSGMKVGGRPGLLCNGDKEVLNEYKNM